jgi:hypothetical protein
VEPIDAQLHLGLVFDLLPHDFAAKNMKSLSAQSLGVGFSGSGGDNQGFFHVLSDSAGANQASSPLALSVLPASGAAADADARVVIEAKVGLVTWARGDMGQLWTLNNDQRLIPFRDNGLCVQVVEAAQPSSQESFTVELAKVTLFRFDESAQE